MEQSERRATYYADGERALEAADSADDRVAAERCRLQAEAVAMATNWFEFWHLAEAATAVVARLNRLEQPSIRLG